MTSPSRESLIRDLTAIAPSDADLAVSPRSFLPTAAHRRALSLDVVVVRGARGSGKTALFRLASGMRDAARLRAYFDDPRLPDATWVEAFSTGPLAHPEVGVLQSYAMSAADSALRAFWMTHLLRRLYDEGVVRGSLPEPLRALLATPAADLAAWLPGAEQQLGSVSAALDAAERELASEGRWVFAAYDGLDLLGPFDHEVRRRYVSALLSLWLSLSTRYARLRGKVFLREDLFDPAQLGFVDAGKLRGRSASLDWDGESLFRLVARHFADTSSEARELLASVPGLALVDRGDDGWMPGPMSEAVQRAFVLKLAPRTVGRGVLKSDAHAWILSRLQDSQRRITPRALLWFLSFAAEEARAAGRKRGPVLAADDLLAALKGTSRARAGEIQEEYPIAKRMESLRGRNVPIERADAVTLLQRPAAGEHATREARGELVVDELVRVGVLRDLPDGRLDVPDIFRYAFEIGPDYAEAWRAMVEKDDPVARENLLRDLPDLGGILRSKGVSLEWPTIEEDIDNGRLDEARKKMETSIHLATTSGDEDGEAQARHVLGRILLKQEEPRSAARELDRAIVLHARLRQPASELLARVYRGIAAWRNQDEGLARDCFNRVITSARKDALRECEAVGHVWLGRLDRHQGNRKEAIGHLLAHRSLGHDSWALHELGTIASKDGRTASGAKLAVLAELVNPRLHAEHAAQLAQRANLAPTAHAALREELRAQYAKDRGWSVIREAFPELPEHDPDAK